MNIKLSDVLYKAKIIAEVCGLLILAPMFMVIVAIWSWYTMFKHFAISVKKSWNREP